MRTCGSTLSSKATRDPRLELAFARWLTEPDDVAADGDLPTVVSRRVTRRSIVEGNARSALIPLSRRQLRQRKGRSN